MTQAIQKKLNDSAWARWTALILVALTMFFGYMFVDVLSPLQNMLESTRGWSPTIFGLYGGSEFILNVCGFLLVAGIILDKMGVRFTGILSASLMVLGAGIKFYGLSNYFYEGGFGYEFLNSFLTDIPASAKPRLPGLHDLRLRYGDGRCDSIPCNRQVVHGERTGSGDGPGNGYCPTGRIRRIQPVALGG